MKYNNIREEELKNKVAQDFFWRFDCSKILGNVDFAVCAFQTKKEITDTESLLWAEAKKGSPDIYKSIVQLILTIGKARTFDKFLPPALLGVFDFEKIAFIPYNDIHDVFYTNDFNWNVAPSNHETKEFKLIHQKVKSVIDSKTLIFNFLTDKKELEKFIKENFIIGRFGLTKTRIDKNNFMVIYNKWLQTVKPTIGVNWDIAKKTGIIDGDFYLADLLSQENHTLKEKLFVLLKHDHYELDRKLDEAGMFGSRRSDFTDKQLAHTQFWNKYERPPKEEYWDYIVERRDLLVPQDVRERKGSFFTPQIWVELSQKYLTDVLGENWQDEYYVWDCAAGTGNLLTGLTNKYNIWASTLDKQDVEVMHDRIKNGANLLDDHVFQFDFLNDDFSKLPKPLQEIINNPEKRKKLVIYINPPYAEAGIGIVSEDKKNKKDVSNQNKIWEQYKNKLGLGVRELFAQFFIRIVQDIPDSKLAVFSKFKFINGDGFELFRTLFVPKFLKGFAVPANTFDNVKGSFPIGFSIWDFSIKEKITCIETDVYDANGDFIQIKKFYADLETKRITEWINKQGVKIKENVIGYTGNSGPDFQHNNYCYIHSSQKINSNGTLNNDTKYGIDQNNLINICIYFSVRHSIEATWLNDRDQFLFPNDGWKSDTEFQNDCLAFTLFHGQNRISSKEGTNHWIPFTEQEVNAKEKFDSNFMSDFIRGKIKVEKPVDLFSSVAEREIQPPRPSDTPPREGKLSMQSDTSRLVGTGTPEEGNNTDSALNSPPQEGWQTKSAGVVDSDSSAVVKKRNTKNYMELPYNPKLKDRAKELRKAGNLSEVLFWNEVKKGKFNGIDFDRQKIVGNYIVDFYCAEYIVVIEIDGSSHDNKQEYDAERDAYLASLGLKVIHIPDKEIRKNLAGVFEMLKSHPAFRPPRPSDTPPEEGNLSVQSGGARLVGTESPQEGNSTDKSVVSEENLKDGNVRLQFSSEANDVFNAGKELWTYYHAQKFPSVGGVSEGRGGYNVNASLYDIREHFQGRNEQGKMNSKSEDEHYMMLINNLRNKLRVLAGKIEPKVYQYGFLKQ